MSLAEAVIWHDLECGSYAADLPLWLDLAAQAGGAVLDIGAGTGRVAIPLARAGHRVHAVEREPELATALAERAAGLPVSVSCADACAFSAPERYALCVVPMQTVQLLADRPGFLRCAHDALAPGGLLAVALLGAGVEPFDVELAADEVELDGVRYASHPTSLRRERNSVVLVRSRERRSARGAERQTDLVRLAELDVATFTAEAQAAGFAAAGTRRVAPTEDHAGSVIVLLRRAER